MSRPSSVMRDAALGYASRGIPVLPLHYPLLHHRGVQPVTDDGQLAHPAVGIGCSCRDPDCGQIGKHPLGVLVPHGLKEATTNRARVLPGGPNSPRPTSAWPPAMPSTSWTSTAPPAPRPSGPSPASST